MIDKTKRISMNTKSLANVFIIAIASIVTLVYGRTLLIPFVFAVLFWFIIREIRELMDRSSFIRTKFPSWVKNIFTSVIIFLGLSFISSIINVSIDSLSSSYKIYESNVDLLISTVNEKLGINVAELIQSHSNDINFGTILNSLINSISDLLGSAFMILIYAIFVFMEESNFRSKLAIIFSEKEQFDKVSNIIGNITSSISKYLGLKTFVSFVTGVCSYIALLAIGIDAPLFWALLIFIFNFIPTVGSLVGTVFPSIFCFLQFGEFTQGLLVLGIVGFIQVLVGNFLEPKLMGNSMNISPLVTILALSFWGAIWGITGMILSVPITVVMILIFSHFPSTKNIAILLSEKGRVD